jgi:hypothetical protein
VADGGYDCGDLGDGGDDGVIFEVGGDFGVFAGGGWLVELDRGGGRRN